MPELPEVETIRRQLEGHLPGRKILGVKCYTHTLRKPLDEAHLNKMISGCKVLHVRRRAKFLVFELSRSRALVLHLGMTGQLRICPAQDEILKHDRVVFSLSRGQQLRLRDVRKFGSVEVFDLPAGGEVPLFSSYGPEPLGEGFTPDYLFQLTRRRKSAIKNVVMDQRYVVGVGNIYASEALFRARVKPGREAGSLTKADCSRLVEGIRSVLSDALEWGGTTFSDYEQVDGSAGEFSQHLQVYGRAGEGCLQCGSLIERTVIGGRSTFHCPRCQK